MKRGSSFQRSSLIHAWSRQIARICIESSCSIRRCKLIALNFVTQSFNWKSIHGFSFLNLFSCATKSLKFSISINYSFSYFSGKNVLNQKTELQRALEKQKERHVISAQNEMNKDCHTSSLHGELGKVIMERAQKNKTKDEQNTCANTAELNEEYLKVRAKLRGCNKYTWYDCPVNSPPSTVSQ